MEIERFDTDRLKKLGDSHDLRFIILHGSYAKGTAGPKSDIDIAVLGKRSLSFDETTKIYSELADIFGDGPGRELDFKSLHGVDPLFRYLVLESGKLLYGDQTDYNEFKIYAFRDYMDSAPLRRLERKFIEARQMVLDRRYGKLNLTQHA